MKKLYSLIFLSLFSTYSFSQTVGIGTETPNPKAALDIQATGSQGVLIPRLQASDTTSFSATVNDKGLLFYDTLSTDLLIWSGLKWNRIKSSTPTALPSIGNWKTNGNSSTLPQLTFGTTSNTTINFKANNANAMTIGNNGKIGIGNLDNTNKLTSDLVVRRSETATDGVNGVFIDIINEKVNTTNSLNGIRFSNYPTTTTNKHTSGALFFQGDGGAGGNGKFILANRNGAGTVTVNDGKLSVDKFGHVGIGTISTTHRLEVIEPADNIKLILSNNFTDQYGLNMSTGDKGKIALTLEDGTFRQAMLLGDFGSGDITKNYFGLSQSKNSGTSWQPDLVVSYAGNIGIGTATPTARLEVNGSIATTPLIHNTTIPNNFTLNHQNRSIIIINNQTSDFEIAGITPSANGTKLTIINMTNQNMTVIDQSNAASTSNRIETLKNGADFTTNRKGAITLIYSTTYNRWISIESNN